MHCETNAPWAYSDALPALYCVTLCIVCFRHFDDAQNVLRVFGMFTILPAAQSHVKRQCGAGWMCWV